MAAPPSFRFIGVATEFHFPLKLHQTKFPSKITTKRRLQGARNPRSNGDVFESGRFTKSNPGARGDEPEGWIQRGKKKREENRFEAS